jgi:hypothetical protein
VNLVNVYENLKTVVKSVGSQHGEDSEQYKAWVEFQEEFPSGTAEEYITRPGNSYHVPFKEFFEGTAEELKGRSSGAAIGADNMMSNILEAETQASVAWGYKSRGFLQHPTRPFVEPRKIVNWEEHGLSGPHLIPASDISDLQESKNAWMKAPISVWTVEQLKGQLRNRYLPLDGKKDVLVQRMMEDDRKMAGDPELLSAE